LYKQLFDTLASSRRMSWSGSVGDFAAVADGIKLGLQLTFADPDLSDLFAVVAHAATVSFSTLPSIPKCPTATVHHINPSSHRACKLTVRCIETNKNCFSADPFTVKFSLSVEPATLVTLLGVWSPNCSSSNVFKTNQGETRVESEKTDPIFRPRCRPSWKRGMTRGVIAPGGEGSVLWLSNASQPVRTRYNSHVGTSNMVNSAALDKATW
jgi:hypothetical protein